MLLSSPDVWRDSLAIRHGILWLRRLLVNQALISVIMKELISIGKGAAASFLCWRTFVMLRSSPMIF